MDTILLALTPEFEMLRDELGYDEYEDFDAYDIMFQQGYDRQLIEVADGETFEVPEGYRATLESDDPDNEFYLLEDEADLLEKENFIADSLPSGNLPLWTPHLSKSTHSPRFCRRRLAS
mgnify:CR=1 FL=1